jgi:CheY-like chemotaxis protein
MAKILVIDDHPGVQELFAKVLVSVGHEVIAAADGRMGLDLYARHRPGLVIIDLVIPGISGLELVDRLRQEPGVKIIAVSGSSVEMLRGVVDVEEAIQDRPAPRGREGTGGRTAAGIASRRRSGTSLTRSPAPRRRALPRRGRAGLRFARMPSE